MDKEYFYKLKFCGILSEEYSFHRLKDAQEYLINFYFDTNKIDSEEEHNAIIKSVMDNWDIDKCAYSRTLV